MARQFRTGLIIEGDARGGIRAIKATDQQLEKLDKQSKRNTRSATRMADAFQHVQRNAGRYTAAVGLAIGGAIALTARQAAAANESFALANAIGTTTGEVQAFGYAAKQAGIESDKAADILKDLTEKIGDASLTGGGELADVLDRIGLSATELQRQSPVDALVSISNAIQDLPAAQQVNVLESIADDGSRLLPLLRDNAEALRRYNQEARDFGIALSAFDVSRLREANQSMQRLYGITEGLSNEFAIALSPAITRAADEAVELRDIIRDEQFQTGVAFISGAIVDMATGLADSVREMGELKTGIDNLDFSKIARFLASRTGPGVLAEQLGFLDDESGGATGSFASGATGSYGDPATGSSKIESLPEIVNNGSQYESLLNTYDKRHDKLVQLEADRRKLNKAIEADPAHAAGYRRALAEVNKQIGALSNNSRTASSQIESAYSTLSSSLSEQIGLFGKTGQAAQLRYQIEQGSLSGLSRARQQHLLSLAQELDGLESQKQAVQALFPEFEKLQRIKALEQQTANLPPELQEFGRRRAGQLLEESAIEGLPQSQGLDPQFNGPFGELNRLQNDQADYEAQYQKRLEAFREYANTYQADSARANEAIEALNRDHEQRITQFQRQQQTARRQGTAALFGDLADLTGAFAGEQSGIYRALFATSKAFALADSIVQIQNGIAKAFNLPFPANIAAAATVAAQSASVIGTIQGTTFAGQAHDGSDSLPRDGTYYMQGGERVVDRRANQDLKAYLARENKAGGGNATHVSVQIVNQGGAPLQETGRSQTSGADGRRQVKIFVKSAMQEMAGNGELDPILGPYTTKRAGNL